GTASASDRNQWIFYFNYESSGCSNPGSSPGYNSKTGATLKARGDIDGGSDFQLVQINSAISSYYNIYYNGWDRSGSSSSSGVAIHHPAGDIKKISTYNSTLTSATWNGSGYIGATNAHWRAYWIATTNGHGVNEGGSSGSPIFNSSGRVLGTLTGGSSSCSNPYWPDLYGKFSYHWQSNGSSSSVQLKPWLDPNNSGVTYLNGYDPNAANPPVADFEADDTSPGVEQTVNFTDLSSESPTSWLWSFSPSTVTYVGGTNSSSQNPQIQFNAQGNYTVSLTAWNAYGSDTETKSNYINVSLHCDASGGANYMYISNVQMGVINNSSGQDFYSDYTGFSTDLAQNQTGVSITVVNGAVYGDEDLGVWIDWNQDGDFYDAGENIVCEVDDDGQGTFTFDVPGSASLGTTRMRVRIKYTGSDCGDPCGTTTYGEVEDYSVNVIPGVAPPVANFEADNLTPGIGEMVSFTDLSTNSPTSWAWTFTPSTISYVGGTNSASQNPEVQFDAGGNYTVELTATNSGGSDTETKVDYIFVIDIPVADFEADNLSPGIGETVNLSDLSTNSPASWQWSFSPSTITYVGGTHQNSQNPQVQFTAYRTYTVALSVSNQAGTDMEIKTDYIMVISPPDAEFEADNLVPGIGEMVSFTDLSINSPTSWAWIFTPSTITYVGGTTATDQDPQVQFDAAGYYTVELTATNISGSDTEIKVDYIFVIDIPVADFEADNITPGIGEMVSFTDLSTNNPISWAWTFTPSTVTYVGGTTSTDQDSQVQFDAAGYYTAELIATNISGSDTETKVDYIFVIDIPNADFEADNTTPGIGETVNFTDLSTNNPISWSWTFTPSTITYVGGTTATDQNPQVQFDAAGNYTVELIATNISGNDTETKVDYINVAVPYIDLEITVFLEGPFNGGSMNTELIPMLPLNQPFNVDPWYY
ncbi:MAG: PKD domain-containing protein, partial [Bacteroidales bacterium]|nr:PKD domain-containing protein [Bacteroidales bacterium]